jgi:hypothetical protein
MGEYTPWREVIHGILHSRCMHIGERWVRQAIDFYLATCIPLMVHPSIY